MNRLNTIPKNFRQLVRQSIPLLGTLAKVMDDESAADYLAAHGIPQEEALEIVIFLPIAFCRKLLPQMNWSSLYTEIDQLGNKREILFDENMRYRILKEEVEIYCSSSPQKEIILGVSGRSAEFHAINTLLLRGGKLEEIKIHQPIITR